MAPLGPLFPPPMQCVTDQDDITITLDVKSHYVLIYTDHIINFDQHTY